MLLKFLLGNTENIKDASKKTIEKLQPLRRVFDDMQSEWKMRKLYERHPRFVSPAETVKIGKNRVNNKYNMAQCISIEKTIQSLVLDPEFAEILLGKSKVDRMNGVYAEYQTGSRFQESKLTKEAMNSEFEILLLQIFSDAASMGNGMRAGAPSCTMFYFNFQNLDPKFNARLANINLIEMR